jgi:Tfp pilus assembly protein PilO
MSQGRKIFGAFVIAIALFFFWPAVLGTWQEVSMLRASVAEREQLLAKRTEILANIAAEHASYTSKIQAEDGQRFLSLVPVRKDSAELVSAIQDIATGAGITIGEMRMDESKTKANEQFKTLSLTLDMSGTYASLRTFLTNLEAHVRLLNVETIEVSNDLQRPGQLKFAVRADTFFIQ